MRIFNKCIASLLSVAQFLKNKAQTGSKKIIYAGFAVISSAAIICGVVFGGVRLAYNIKYDDTVITTVSDKHVYYDALDLVAVIVENEGVKDILPEPSIDTILTIDGSFDNCNEVAEAIIDNTDEIVAAAKLVVDGQTVGFADTGALYSALEARKGEYDEAVGTDCESDFCADVSVEEGFFIASDVSDISALADRISALDVKTTAKIVSQQEVSYKTVVNKDSSEEIGYSNVERRGETGINSVAVGVVYVNGVKTEETSVTVEVVKEPVDEIITVGTKVPPQSTVKLSTGFRFPLPSGVWTVSCPYGRYGHKGVDLTAPCGTAIMAAASGTVVMASYNGSYGNCVIIDHGNGVETLYAHASRLCVNVGDRVSAGDVVALVGTTGRSTGYHLHFEVHIGSERVNPQPYIGL